MVKVDKYTRKPSSKIVARWLNNKTNEWSHRYFDDEHQLWNWYQKARPRLKSTVFSGPVEYARGLEE